MTHFLATTLAQSEPDSLTPEPGGAGDPQPVWLANILMAAAVVLLIIVALGRVKKRAAQQSAAPQLDPAERIAAIRAKASEEAGLEGRSAAAAERIRELTAVLDTRIEHLDILIAQADDRIAKLDELNSRRPGALVGHHEGPEPPTTSGSTATAAKHEIYALADQGLTPREIAARLGQHAGKVELILALRRV